MCHPVEAWGAARLSSFGTGFLFHVILHMEDGLLWTTWSSCWVGWTPCSKTFFRWIGSSIDPSILLWRYLVYFVRVVNCLPCSPCLVRCHGVVLLSERVRNCIFSANSCVWYVIAPSCCDFSLVNWRMMGEFPPLKVFLGCTPLLYRHEWPLWCMFFLSCVWSVLTCYVPPCDDRMAYSCWGGSHVAHD